MTTVIERIKADVTNELAWDSRVLATDVHVDVDDGVVTLSGTVPSHFSRQSAVEDASHVRGVVDVVDRLGVRYPEVVETPTDDRIAANVENVLDWTPDIDIVDVAVSVSGGVVTLEGTVDALWKRAFAEELVLGLGGVVGVENHLAIVPGEDIDDQAIADALMAALERRPHIDPSDINVTVEEGVVTLGGTVPSILAQQIAFETARRTVGVREVANHTTVAGSHPGS